MRYKGNSFFDSWKLSRKVGIIEGMSSDVKAVKKRGDSFDINSRNLEGTRIGKKKEASHNNDDDDNNTPKDFLDKRNKSKGEGKDEPEKGANMEKFEEKKKKSKNLPKKESKTKLPMIKLNRSKLGKKTPREKDQLYELKPVDTKVDVFYVNA